MNGKFEKELNPSQGKELDWGSEDETPEASYKQRIGRITPISGIRTPVRARRTRRNSKYSIRRDPRAEGSGGILTEVAPASLDARDSFVPEIPNATHDQQLRKSVQDLARSSPDTVTPLRNYFLRLGPQVLPHLVDVFPGAMWVDLTRPHHPHITAYQLSALTGTIIGFGEAAVPYIEQLLGSRRAHTRYCAALMASEQPHSKLVGPLLQKLQDPVLAVREAAVNALRKSAHLPETQRLRTELLQALQSDDTREKTRLRSIAILGQLRDPKAVAALIDCLECKEKVASAARRALTNITAQDWGRFRPRWDHWWKRASKKARFHWLVEALDQPGSALRTRALEELVLLTGQGFEYLALTESREESRRLQVFFDHWWQSRKAK